MDPVNPNQQPPNTSAGATSPRGFMATLEYYLVTKAPFQIPAGGKELIVKIGPWIQLIALIVIAPVLLALLGLSASLSPYMMYGGYGRGWGISAILTLVSLVIGIIALPGLFKRKMMGWNFAFYGVIVSLVSNLVTGNIIGAIIGFVIGAYILFQIRSYYH